MKKALKFYGIGLLLLLITTVCKAQKKDLDKEVLRVPPKAILVMLFTENNRREALVKAGRLADTPILRMDATAVRENMVSDFSRNFDYCPVYYFMDEHLKAVLARKFNGVLLDSTMRPVRNVPINDTNYLIVYYGAPEWQSQESNMAVTEMADMSGKPNGNGLVINNHEMKQVGYNYALPVTATSKNSAADDLKYVSKRFNIEYVPLAIELDSKLMFYADKYARKQRETGTSGNNGAK